MIDLSSRLASGDTLYGTFLGLGSALAAEACALDQPKRQGAVVHGHVDRQLEPAGRSRSTSAWPTRWSLTFPNPKSCQILGAGHRHEATCSLWRTRPSLEDVSTGSRGMAATAPDNERTAMQLHADGGACR
jgi:hypothetical protein